MGWIENHLRRDSRTARENNPEAEFAEQARQRWLALGEELRADVAEFNSHHSGAYVSQPADNQYVVSNAVSGLQLTITADFDAQTVSYDYSQINARSAGIPEGGMLSMRQSRRGDVEFYSADERLTSEETRQVLLEPLLFPRQSSAA